MLITKKTFFGVETCCVWKWEWLLTNKNLITHFYWKTTQFLRCSIFKVSQSLTFSHELWDSESELFCVWNKSRDWSWAKSCYQEIFFIRMNSQQERRTFKQMFCLCAYLFFYVAKAAKTFPATQDLSSVLGGSNRNLFHLHFPSTRVYFEQLSLMVSKEQCARLLRMNFSIMIAKL